MTAVSETTNARRYRGSSADERRAQRRTQLIAAAVRIYGERGYRSATVKAVCEAAGLTERYFYESFANSEALLVASFKAVTHILLSEIDQAAVAAGPDGSMQVRAMLRAYYAALKRDPASARVFLVEIGGVSAAVDQALAEALDTLAQRLSQALGVNGSADARLRQAGATGAVIHIALTWIAADYAQPLDAVVEAAHRHCLLLKPAEQGVHAVR